MWTRGLAPFITAMLGISPAVTAVSLASERAVARPGATVRVTTAPAGGHAAEPPAAGPDGNLFPGGGIVLGTLVDLDRDTITVLRRTEKDRIRIPRAEIERLEVAKGSTRGRRAWIGAAAGAAAGLVYAVIEHSRCQGEFLCGVEFAAPILTTPAGALLGFATGGRRWVEAAPTSSGVDALPRRRGIRVGWTITF